MNLKELVLKSRSYRRFDESYQIDAKTIESLIDLARLSPTGANKQPLKFLYFNTPDECNRIFPYIAWAGYLSINSANVNETNFSVYCHILFFCSFLFQPEGKYKINNPFSWNSYGRQF